MQLLNVLTDDADQKVSVSLPDGSLMQLEFIYRPGIQRWTVDINYGTFQLVGFILACGPNILRQWRNLLPYGMAVQSTDLIDPVLISDFLNGRISVYILWEAELQQVETQVLFPVPLVNP
jgi:hypothetical protein